MSAKLRVIFLILALGSLIVGWAAYRRHSATPRLARVGESRLPSIGHEPERASVRGARSIRRPSPAEAPDLRELREEAREGKSPYDRPDEAAAFYRFKRVPEGEVDIPVDRYFEARERMQSMPMHSLRLNRALPSRAELKTTSVEGAGWTPLGPGNVGGRTRALLIHPSDPRVMYAAGVAGGVWKTTDGGASWAPVGDLLPNLAVNSMAMDPKNPNVIYAGTGEGYFNIDAVRGAGIFKTVDGGAAWTRLTGTTGEDFYYVNDLVVSASNSQRVYAATRTGIWRSLDGGASWGRVLDGRRNDSGPEDVGCLDLALRTDRATDVVFASCGSFRSSTVYRNADAGGAGAWETVLSEDGGRTSLAIAPSNQNVVYALSAFRFNGSPASYGLYAVYRSTSGGDAGSWTQRNRYDSATRLNTVLLSNPILTLLDTCGLGASQTANQGWYDNVIAVDPVDPDRVWAGGVDLFRSDDGGANWGIASYWWADKSNPRYAHADHHALVFHPQYNGAGNRQLFVGTDGGVFRTDDARASVAVGSSSVCNANASGVNWVSLNNGYAVTQFYHGAVFPDGKSYFGGTQDNGTPLGADASGANGWRELYSGDGGYVAVDPVDPSRLYVETTQLSLRKSTDGGQTFGRAVSGADGSQLFITPFAMDPSDPQRLWMGGWVWPHRTTNGAGRWEQAGADFATQGYISALAAAPTNADLVLAGTTNGYLHRTANGLTSDRNTVWPAARPREGYVSWVAFDPGNASVAYATYSTFGGAHVWRSVDAGASWTSIDGAGGGALPDVPVHCLVVDPSNSARLFIGTDLGVFVSSNGGASWTVEYTGFPNTVVESLALNTTGGVTSLYAFTHGRGAWRVTVSSGGCGFRLATRSASFGAAGGAGSVGVTVDPGGCAWTVASNADWIKPRSGGGSASGTASFDVTANPTAASRTGTIAVAGRSFVVTQAGVIDTTAPSVLITSPSATGEFRTTAGTVNLAGTATDDLGVTRIAWRSDRGGSGAAEGTTQWKINGLPLAGGRNRITVTGLDASGNERAVDIAILYNPPEAIATIAGNGTTGFSGDGGPATAAQMNEAYDVVVDSKGNVYFSDLINNRIRKVTPAGIISTYAGSGRVGFSGDGGPATAADLRSPFGLGIDRNDNVYFCDFNNNRIRRVDAATGIITTVVDAAQGLFSYATDVAVDAAGNLFIASWGTNRVSKVTPAGAASIFAGTGEQSDPLGDGGPATQANMLAPRGIAVDAAGNVYISQDRSYIVRKVAPNGIITTVAGNGGETSAVGDGGPATKAFINTPYGLAVDSTGNLYIAEYKGYRIRKVAPNGVITTVAGTGDGGYSGDGGPGTAAKITPIGVFVDSSGQVYIADDFNQRIRKVSFSSGNDATAPVVAITAPTSAASFAATSSTLRIAGTATDNASLTHVAWTSDRGDGGGASGTGAWSFDLTPRPGLNNLTVTAWDAAGNAGSARLALTYTPPNVAVPVAGDAGPLRNPETLAFDKAGNLFIVDTGNHVVRKVARDGRASVFAGNGQVGSSGDGGPAVQASLNSPSGIAIDAAGNVYIADTNNHRIRKVTPAGVISTVAGTGVDDFGGDGGPATAARLDTPIGLAIDLNGDLLIADAGNHRLRKLRPSTGVISTIAGGYGLSPGNTPASETRFHFPTAVVVDGENNLYVSDTGNHQVRKITSSGGTSVIVGGPGFRGDGEPLSGAQVTSPGGLAIDAAGALYIADQGNDRVRRIAGGTIDTVAGAAHLGPPPTSDIGFAATRLWLSAPAGVAIDPADNLFIADTGNHRVLSVAPSRNVASVSAASFAGPAAAGEQILAAFGVNLATRTEIAATTPLPTQLAGTSVRIRDSAGVERAAPLFFVSSGQINYQVPPGTASGPATVSILNGDGLLSTGGLSVSAVAPGLFSATANGQGIAAAVVLRIRADGAQLYESVADFDAAQNRFVPRPIDLGPASDQVFLILFGTGLRNRNALSTVGATLAGAPAEVLYAGAQGGLVGLDQVNLRLPRSLAGRGETQIALTVDGKPANIVTVTIK